MALLKDRLTNINCESDTNELVGGTRVKKLRLIESRLSRAQHHMRKEARA